MLSCSPRCEVLLPAESPPGRTPLLRGFPSASPQRDASPPLEGSRLGLDVLASRDVPFGGGFVESATTVWAGNQARVWSGAHRWSRQWRSSLLCILNTAGCTHCLPELLGLGTPLCTLARRCLLWLLLLLPSTSETLLAASILHKLGCLCALHARLGRIEALPLRLEHLHAGLGMRHESLLRHPAPATTALNEWRTVHGCVHESVRNLALRKGPLGEGLLHHRGEVVFTTHAATAATTAYRRILTFLVVFWMRHGRPTGRWLARGFCCAQRCPASR
mmetsp:Transcript_18177/g.53115  ORF Transcript_18177/g.53115 Transcript_18177/m.53115 type:complete len:276 (+) Transcript_18177:309-1136(+)